MFISFCKKLARVKILNWLSGNLIWFHSWIEKKIIRQTQVLCCPRRQIGKKEHITGVVASDSIEKIKTRPDLVQCTSQDVSVLGSLAR